MKFSILKHSMQCGRVLAFLCCIFQTASAIAAQPEVQLGSASMTVAEATTFWLAVQAHAVVAPVGTLVLSLTLNDDAVEILDLEPATGLDALGKQTYYRLEGNEITFISTWGEPIAVPSMLFRLLLAPTSAEPTLDWLSGYTASAASPNATELAVAFAPGAITVAPASAIFHSADANRDKRIDLSELLQAIQLYQLGAYHCKPGPEGSPTVTYAPGPGADDTFDCPRHDSDFRNPPWQISLAELLHLVQLYNAPGYVLDEDNEERFRPAYSNESIQ